MSPLTFPLTLWLHSHLPSPLCLPFADVPKGKVGRDGNRRRGVEVREPPCSSFKVGQPMCCLLSKPPYPPLQTSAVWGRHCQTETSAMPRAASSNCPSLRLSTLASPGVQLSCEGDQNLLNSTGLPTTTDGAWGAQPRRQLAERLCPWGSGSASSAVGQVITLPARTALWSPQD